VAAGPLVSQEVDARGRARAIDEKHVPAAVLEARGIEERRGIAEGVVEGRRVGAVGAHHQHPRDVLEVVEVAEGERRRR